jgi:hypothetical protein
MFHGMLVGRLEIRSAVESAVYERSVAGNRQWFHRVRQWGALSGGVGAWRPRDGVHGAA